MAITIDVPPFGTLIYDERYNWYAGHAEWRGKDAELVLSCGSDDADAAIRVAQQLFRAQADWDRRIADRALETLLPLKNEVWLGEGERELTATEFTARMTLQSIHVDESGDLTFWYDDGDLFWGHSIQVYGHIERGPQDAQIAG